MTIATIKVMFHEKVFRAAQLCNIVDKMVFVQVISMLLHFALLYFPLKIIPFCASLVTFRVQNILGKKLLQFAFICVKSYNAA